MYVILSEDIKTHIAELKIAKAKLEIVYYTSVIEKIEISETAKRHITSDIQRKLDESEEFIIDINRSGNNYETESEVLELIDTHSQIRNIINHINN